MTTPLQPSNINTAIVPQNRISLRKYRRIFRKNRHNSKIYAMNLTSAPINCFYLGSKGIKLPAYSNTAEPVLTKYRNVISYTKSIKLYNQMKSDTTSGKLIIGNYEECVPTPVFTVTPEEPTAVTGTATTFTVTAALSSPATTLDVTMDEAPEGATFIDGTVSWTPTETGVGEFVFSATNNGVTTEHTVEIAPEWPNPHVAATFTVTPAAPQLNHSMSYSFTVTASVPGSGTLLPVTASVSPEAFGTPTIANGVVSGFVSPDFLGQEIVFTFSVDNDGVIEQHELTATVEAGQGPA